MIERTTRDGIAILTLAHGKANALDLELCTRLTEVLDELRAEPVCALVLTGQGRIFSAGVDLLRLLDGGVDYVRAFLPALQRAFRAAFSFPAPVVAAINGHAVAGGCILAATADRRLLADSGGRVGLPELRVGVPFPAEAIEVMRSVLPPGRFRTLVVGGAMLDAGAAHDWGLVDQVVQPDSLMEQALRAARDLATIPPEAFRLTKQQMRAPALARMDEAERTESETLLRIWTDPATLGAVKAYVAKTLRRGD
jgi:enoyl-CoA hydratase